MDATRVRLAEVLTSLALAIDLGLGLPMQTVLRTTLVAERLARAAGLSAPDVAAAYYLAILRYVGCSTTSHQTSFFVDELALADLLVMADEEMLPGLAKILGAGKSEAEGQAAAEQLMAGFATGAMALNHHTHCEAAQLIARRLGLGAAVVDGLAHTYERWDGHSTQGLARGDAISLPMRVVQVAYQAGQDKARYGAAEIAARVGARGGRQFDPALAGLFASDPGHFLAGLDGTDLTRDVLAAEPGGPAWLTGSGIDEALTAIADFGDLKSPHMRGHSRRVARIGAAAASAASLPGADVAEVGRAALVHDIGRVGVQAQLLCKPGELTRAEHERIRLHSYLTGRIFADTPALAPLGSLGSAHHERLDGSGYHRGLAGPALSAKARLLAAANAWCALTEARPHRPQMTEAEAAAALSAQARQGLFNRAAVDAVLTVTGQKGSHARRAPSVALTEREIEVLQLLAREATNAAIATALGISVKTVERHTTHIYGKLGVATRGGAALYALENGLL